MTGKPEAGGGGKNCETSGTGKMQCYLDMDGLLADLFDTVAKRLHQKRYAETTTSERQVTRSLWLEREGFASRVGDIEELFTNLAPYPTNSVLLDLVCERFGGFHICSHPAKIDPMACIRGKQAWIEKHILPTHGEFLLGVHFPDKKENFANAGGTRNLLVDDYSPYINAWTQAGGYAIRIRADKFPDVEGFKDYFLAELNNAGL